MQGHVYKYLQYSFKQPIQLNAIQLRVVWMYNCDKDLHSDVEKGRSEIFTPVRTPGV